MQRKQWEGRTIDGRFGLRQYLGGSAHSAVFSTELSEAPARKAAIKLVPADRGKADAWVLRRELAARLAHPGLLSIFQFGACRIDDSVFAYAVMEPSDEDLSQVIPTRPLTEKEARELLLAVVEILEYVHAQGFVHGRLTAANIMAAGDRIKISSDGLFRAGESSGDLWAPNPNDPPESRAGMTPAGDIWWLGMTLVEALTQRAPAWNGTRTDDPAAPQTLAAPFREIARGCLRTDPRLRYSLAEISAALQPERPAPHTVPRATVAVPAVKPAAHAKPVAAPTAKRKYLLPVAGAVLAGVIVTAAVLTGMRWLGSPSGTASAPVAPVGQATAQGKTEAVPVAQAGGEIVPGDAKPADAPLSGEAAPADNGKPADAPPAAPVTELPAASPAPQESAPAASGASSDGDVAARVVPEIPASILATVRGRFGVSVRVTVDGAGAVVDAALDSRPGSKYFDRVSLDAARRWKFKPASGGGATRLVRFEFRREGCVASYGGASR